MKRIEEVITYFQDEIPDYCNRLILINAKSLKQYHSLPFSPSEWVLIGNISDKNLLQQIFLLLRTKYRDDAEMAVVIEKGNNGFRKKYINIENATKMDEVGFPMHILINPQANLHSFTNFVDLIAHLRSPEGCPWDREQTHQSLRPNLLSETYEVLNALDSLDADELKEELGDLLLQIILHAQIASEKEEFNIDGVISNIYRKLVERHPHVFSDLDIIDSAGVIHNWEIIKEKEREKKGKIKGESILRSIPRDLPALALAQEYQKRAARVGFDWQNIEPVFEKINEELAEVVKAQEGKKISEIEQEIGDLLFAIVNFSRWINIDSESALREACERFSKRFGYIESRVKQLGKRIEDYSLKELDAFWDEAKTRKDL